MTRKELSQLYWLNREIEREKCRLAELEAAATNTAVNITGLPHAGGLSDRTALAAEIADARTIIEAKVRASIAEYNRLIRYINGIDDSFIRQIFMLRYVNGLSWNQVALSIGGNSEDSVRMAHNRYLEKN